MSGALHYDIPILDAVRPFIVVTAKPKRGDDEQDEDSKPRGKKRKGKKKADESDAPQPPPRHVLVVHRIATVQHAGEPHLIFNAVGFAQISCLGCGPLIYHLVRRRYLHVR